MKIALIGYGKMGKAIHQMAESQGHQVVLTIDENQVELLESEQFKEADVAIEFSRPEAAHHNISACLKAGVPVVSGTTGWLDRFEEICQLCKEEQGGFVYASNFSIGVNLFMAVNEYLAKLMNQQNQYNVSMEEIHHTQKLDAPSGTGITLAEGILKHIDRKEKWINHPTDQAEQISIISKRIDEVPGTHSIVYENEVDKIEITHTAHSRAGFVQGAINAAAWVIGKQGCFGMKDVLGF